MQCHKTDKINVFNNYAYITPTYIVPNNNPICTNNLNKVDNKNKHFYILLQLKYSSMYKMNVSEENLSELILYYQINPLFETVVVTFLIS